MYSQSTLTGKVSLTGSPIPLLAVQRYCPVKFLLMFTIRQELPTNSTLLFVPSPNTLVQVIFGAGLPVALQYKSRLEPSVTVCPSRDEVILDGAERNEYDNVWLWSSFIITLIITNYFRITFISKGGENNGSIYTLYCATVAVFIAVTMTSQHIASLGSCMCIFKFGL